MHKLEKYKDSIEKILFDPTVGKMALLAILFVVLAIVSGLLKKAINRKVQDSNTRYRAKKFTNFFAFVIAALLCGVVFSDRLGGVTVAFGVAGAGIAFALQEVIASFAGWFAITFGKFFNVGDRVLLGGIRGDVIDVSVLRTTLMECGDWVKGDLYNGRIVRIANSFVFKEPVYNYSANFPFLWDEIVIPVKYGSDLSIARELIKKCADEVLDDYENGAKQEWQTVVKNYAIEDARVENMVTLTADENWVSFTLRYVTDYKMRRKTKDLLFTSILQKIEQSDGKVSIAGASMDVNVINPSVIK